MKVLSNLAANPLLVPKYISNLVNAKNPTELQLIGGLINPFRIFKNQVLKKCFEWGSGGSTFFLAKICNSVTTIENDLNWYNKIRLELQNKELHNVSLRHEEIELSDQDGFQKSAYLNSLDKI